MPSPCTSGSHLRTNTLCANASLHEFSLLDRTLIAREFTSHELSFVRTYPRMNLPCLNLSLHEFPLYERNSIAREITSHELTFARTHPPGTCSRLNLPLHDVARRSNLLHEPRTFGMNVSNKFLATILRKNFMHERFASRHKIVSHRLFCVRIRAKTGKMDGTRPFCTRNRTEAEIQPVCMKKRTKNEKMREIQSFCMIFHTECRMNTCRAVGLYDFSYKSSKKA